MGSIPRPLRQDGGSALKGTVPAAENAAGTDSLYGQNDGYGREISRFEERIGFVVWAVLHCRAYGIPPRAVRRAIHVVMTGTVVPSDGVRISFVALSPRWGDGRRECGCRRTGGMVKPGTRISDKVFIW